MEAAMRLPWPEVPDLVLQGLLRGRSDVHDPIHRS